MAKRQTLKEKMAAVKKQIAEKKDPPPIDKKAAMAVSLGFSYEKVLGEYTHRPTLKYFKRIGEEGIHPRTMGYLRKAASIAESHGVDVETFVRAQFYWFHTWFRRPPKIWEMCSVNGKFPATRRVVEYLKLKNDKRVFSSSLPSKKIDSEKLDKINRERLEQLSKTWGKSHTEILMMFGPAGVFDVEWLADQPVWQKLTHKGKI
jgi:hypothetical protein